MRTERRGTVLVVAMVILFALASMVIVLAQRVRVEAAASANDDAAVQARAVARGAEQFVLGLLSESTDPIQTLDEQTFAAVPLGTGYFWLVRPDYRDPTLPAFGLVDESAKLDLNRASRDVLARLPGMTDPIAAAIVDWRDADDTVTDMGAESETYLQQRPPYRAKNAPFETVEELLLIDGVSRDLLYGPRQAAAGGILDNFASDLYQTIGEFDFLTVWGTPATVAADGTTRLNPNRQQSRNQFIAMLREQLGETRGNEVAALLGRPDLRNELDFAVRTRLSSTELATLEPYLNVEPIAQTGTPAPRLRVNVNAAPREVLLCLDGLSAADADALLARRPAIGATHDAPDGIAWVLDAFGEPQRASQKLIDLGDQITGGGACWSADILAVSGNGRAFQRVRVVVKTGGAAPRIVYRRDITERGWPLDGRILTSLRGGEGLQGT